MSLTIPVYAGAHRMDLDALQQEADEIRARIIEAVLSEAERQQVQYALQRDWQGGHPGFADITAAQIAEVERRMPGALEMRDAQGYTVAELLARFEEIRVKLVRARPGNGGARPGSGKRPTTPGSAVNAALDRLEQAVSACQVRRTLRYAEASALTARADALSERIEALMVATPDYPE